VLALFLAMAAFPACRHASQRTTGELVGGYFADRGGDLIDMAALDASFGGWLGARARLGQLAHAGAGYEDAARTGWRFGAWESGREERHAWLPVSWFVPSDAAIPMHTGTETLPPHRLDEPPPPHDCYLLFPWLSSDVHAPGKGAELWGLDMDVAVQGPGIGLGVGFSPGEMLDFVGGWFGVDLADDDTLSRPPK
jgi:hypothetical protein